MGFKVSRIWSERTENIGVNVCISVRVLRLSLSLQIVYKVEMKRTNRNHFSFQRNGADNGLQ